MQTLFETIHSYPTTPSQSDYYYWEVYRSYKCKAVLLSRGENEGKKFTTKSRTNPPGQPSMWWRCSDKCLDSLRR